MMNVAHAIDISNALVAAVPFLGGNTDEQHYNEAMELVEHLLLNDPENPLVDILCDRISAYEATVPELVAFKAEMDAIPNGIALLRVLIDQYELTLSSFKDEIGDKSIVSRILSGERKLTLTHIQKLAERFGIPPALFI